MEIKEIIAPVQKHLNEFELTFNKKLHSNIPLAEKVVRYIAEKRGKRLRPLLVFLTAELHGTPNDVTMASAIVIEMLHTATLIHDDVIDDSNLRRGHPTVNNIWNSKVSILVGDFLFSKTLTTMVELKNLDAFAILSDTANDITEGELLQLDNNHQDGLNEPVYFDLITKKTASLISASCMLGSLSVSDNKTALNQMQLFGRSLGIAFQITDDLLDYTGSITKLGKPTGNDIREHKITLPLIYALSNAESSVSRSIIKLFENGKIEDKDVKHIIQFTHEYGGVNYSEQTARNYASQADEILNTYHDSMYKSTLKELIEFSVSRDV